MGELRKVSTHEFIVDQWNMIWYKKKTVLWVYIYIYLPPCITYVANFGGALNVNLDYSYISRKQVECL